MSLLQLLSVGRSLVGFKNDAGRYTMTAENRLPKFGASDRFPSHGGNRSSDAACMLVDAPRRPRQAELSQTDGVKTVAPEIIFKNAESKPEVTSKVSGAPVAPPSPGRWKIFWAKLFGSRSTQKSRASRPMVQGELSLDAVKVVRNDLNDADVELVSPTFGVPQKRKSKPTAKKGERWTELSVRLFEAGRSRLS